MTGAICRPGLVGYPERESAGNLAQGKRPGVSHCLDCGHLALWQIRPLRALGQYVLLNPRTRRFVGLPSFAPLAFFAWRAATVRSDSAPIQEGT
jgi:hypothetical protein